MADDFGLYDVRAHLQGTYSSSLDTALLPPSGNLNLRRKPERDKRDAALIADDDQSFNRVHDAFHSSELSASMHEVTSLNAFFSGTQALEQSAVPASGAFFYSKNQRFVRKIYAVTASVDLPITPANETSPATDENLARATFVAGSGSYRNNSFFNPSIIEIEVPERGKIRDLKVWVELVHDHRGGTGTGSFTGNPFLGGGTGDTTYHMKQGLQGLQLSLRSPNVTFDYAHPLWNDKTVGTFEKWPTSEVNSAYRRIPELLKNSYLLWAGHACEEDLGYSLGPHTGTLPDRNTLDADSNYTTRTITSSSVGPGISGSGQGDNGSYQLFGVPYPAYRTLSSIIVNGANPYVLYPTRNEPASAGQTQYMMLITDDGIPQEPTPPNGYFVQFFSASNWPNGQFKMNSPRLRVQKNSQFIQGAAIVDGTAIAYGTKAVLDSNHAPWRLKFPSICGGLHTYAHVGADSFFDFALDSLGNPHFVMAQWRGDQGISQVGYVFYSGSTAEYNTPPAGTSLYTHSAGGPSPGAITSFPKRHDFWTRTTTATADALYPDVMAGILDNPILNRDPLNPAGSVGAYIRMEIDTVDHMHVVYADTASRSVKYAHKQVAYQQWSGSWSFEHVFKHPASSLWPTYISLDLDKSNRPHIAYSLFSGSTEHLFYAHSSSVPGQGWILEKVASVPGIKFGTNIKMDNFDVPVIVTTISNFDGKGNETVIIYRSSSLAGWVGKPVYLNRNDNPRDTTLVFDVNNRVRLYTGGDRLGAHWEKFSLNQAKYFEYNTDIDMRTIFTDGSRNLNPRNLSPLFTNPTPASPGGSKLNGQIILDAGAHPSPFSASLPVLQAPGVWGTFTSRQFTPILDQTSHLTGCNVPWMFDNRIPPGIFTPLNQTNVINLIGSSPPPGWLTGPGGTANENEFPTTGSNFGPRDIQPVYPLMDDIFVEKIQDQAMLTSNAQLLPTSNRARKIIGFRPGLRGTQAQGKWQLMIGTTGKTTGGNVAAHPRAGVWFRQVRLEFILDQGEDIIHNSYVSKSKRFGRPAYVPSRHARQIVAILSGSAAWDVGVNYVYVDQPPTYGRSIGIIDSTGSAGDAFAVFSQITGSLRDILSEESASLDFYLKNEFGTPYIPLSTGSADDVSFNIFDAAEAAASRQVFNEVLRPTTFIPPANTLKSMISRADYTLSTRDSIFRKSLNLPFYKAQYLSGSLF